MDFGWCCWFDLSVYDFTLVGLAGLGSLGLGCVLFALGLGDLVVSDELLGVGTGGLVVKPQLVAELIVEGCTVEVGCLGGYYVGFALRVCLYCFSGFGVDFGLVLSVFPDCVYLRSLWVCCCLGFGCCPVWLWCILIGLVFVGSALVVLCGVWFVCVGLGFAW